MAYLFTPAERLEDEDFVGGWAAGSNGLKAALTVVVILVILFGYFFLLAQVDEAIRSLAGQRFSPSLTVVE